MTDVMMVESGTGDVNESTRRGRLGRNADLFETVGSYMDKQRLRSRDVASTTLTFAAVAAPQVGLHAIDADLLCWVLLCAASPTDVHFAEGRPGSLVENLAFRLVPGSSTVSEAAQTLLGITDSEAKVLFDPAWEHHPDYESIAEAFIGFAVDGVSIDRITKGGPRTYKAEASCDLEYWVQEMIVEPSSWDSTKLTDIRVGPARRFDLTMEFEAETRLAAEEAAELALSSFHVISLFVDEVV